MPRLTILIVLYTVPCPPWRIDIILFTILGNTSPNPGNRELTGGYGVLHYPRWRIDVERFIMQRIIESRYEIVCPMRIRQIALFYGFESRQEFQLLPFSCLL